MQILTQGGGYITVHSVRSNEDSFYIMENLMIKNN